MKRALATAVGALGGLLLAGAIAPALVSVAPPPLRGAPLLVLTAVVLVALAAAGAWRASSGRR